MKKKKIYVPYRRKREGKTNYKKRLKLLLSKKPRLVVRKTNRHIIAQIVQYSQGGDKILISAHTKELEKFGWKFKTRNIPAAYLVGLLCGVKAKKKEIKEAILDIGFHPSIKGSIIYSVVKGAIDADLKIPCDEKMFPPEERIKGKHIAEYAKLLKSNEEKFKKQFSEYIEKNLNIEDIEKNFAEVEGKIRKWQ